MDGFQQDQSFNVNFNDNRQYQRPFSGSNVNSSQTTYSDLTSVTEQLRQLETSIKILKKNGKDNNELTSKMIMYSKVSNENVQKMDLNETDGLKQALLMLQKCNDLLVEINDEDNEFNEQQYETLNNLARCYNFQGNIRKSLTYLLKAYTQVQRIQSKQESGTVTIMPELSLNICNAYIYENDNNEALQYANKSLKSSSQCIIFLKRKIKVMNTKIDDIFVQSEINRLKQMYMSQITLQIQAFQAKGKIYEKLNKYREAIRQYNFAKEIIEKKFGTNHKLFKEIVNQVSAANIIIKSKNYQGAGRQSSRLQQKQNSLKKLKDNKSPEKYVQFSEDTIDIRSVGGESDFGNNSIMSDRSIRTEDYELNRKSLISGNFKKRRLQSARKSSLNDRKNSKNSSRNKRLKYQGFNSQMIQPTICGLPYASLNPLNQGKKIIRNGELINFKKYYGPKIYDPFYLHRPQDRPISFYQTLYQLENARRRPKSQIKKIVYRKAKNEQQPLPQLQQQTVQTSQTDEKLEEYIKEVQIRQFEQKQKIIIEMENQKMQIIEYQRQERERARQEREAFIQELAILTTKIQQKVILINQQKIKIDLPEPEVQVPPIHPNLGPAVYDYINQVWVYPYSQWYGGEIPKGKERIEEVEDITVIEKLKPLPETVDRWVQESEPIIQKPVFLSQEIQTFEFEREDLDEIQIQTDKIYSNSAQVQTEEIVKKTFNRNNRNLQLIKDRAARMIQSLFRSTLIRIKEKRYFYGDNGILLTRKRRYNKLNGSFEIMSMYVVASLENRCQSLRFTLFNFRTKHLFYIGTYTKMLYLNEFNVFKLIELSKPSLDLIQFEISPFRHHLICLQSVINASRIQKRPMKEVVIIDEQQEMEEEIIVIQKPGMKNFSVQLDNKNPEWELINDDQGYIMYPRSKMDLRKRKEKQKMDFIQYIIKIQSWWKNQKTRFAILRYIENLYNNRKSVCLVKRSIKFGNRLKLFNLQLFKVIKRNYDKNENLLNKEIIYELIATEIVEKKENQDNKELIKEYENQIRKKVHYHNMRLPEDPELLRNYIKEATVLEIDQKTGQIKNLKLLRIMIKPKQNPDTGCFVKAEFPLINYKNYICKIYKRTRWELLQRNQQIVTDWKIKVIQKDEPQSEDYIVVRRLPCKLDEIQSLIQNTLSVIPNRRVIPNSILHLQWKVKGIIINSQKYYDLNSSRLVHEHHNTWYITQYPRTNVRIPNENDINKKNWGNFYEIYIQKMVPKVKENKPIRYRTKEYLQYKEKKRDQKYGQYRDIRRAGSPSSSESEDDNLPEKYDDPQAQIFWDEKQLIRMQLDEVTEAREYYKITVTKTSDKQDTDYFRIEKDIVNWPHPDVEYQYITENLSIKQIKNEVTGDYNIEVTGLRIRNKEQRFISDEAWSNSLIENDNEIVEQYMAQDETRWLNQNFASTVYNTESLGGGFLVEVINIDKPIQRAYKRLKTLVGMRGVELKLFLDEKLRIIGTNQSAEIYQEQNQLLQAGYSDEDIIKSIEFECTPEEFQEKLKRNPNYLQDRIDAKQLETIQEEKKEEQKADRKQEKIVNAGVWAKFNMFTDVQLINKNKKIDLQIEVKRYVNPAYFKIIISNTLNLIQNDTISLKLLRLPDPLKAQDKDLNKIKEVFQQKLKIEWLNPRKWANQKIPLMKDAYIDNSYVKEEIIHKIVEVKEWNKYYKKVGELDSSESEEQEMLQQEQSEIQQDIIKLKDYLDQISKYLKNVNGGIENWFKQYDKQGIDLQAFQKILFDLKIKIEGRLSIMLYCVFDRSYSGKFIQRDFEDVILKRIQLNFKKIVYKERQRYKLQGDKIVFQKGVI